MPSVCSTPTKFFFLLADIIIHEWLGEIIDDTYMYKYEFITSDPRADPRAGVHVSDEYMVS